MSALLLGLALAAGQYPRPIQSQEPPPYSAHRPEVLLPAPSNQLPPPPAIGGPGLPPGIVLPPGALPPPVMVPARPLTIDEFAACFQAAPGSHRVCLFHPVTKRPVDVCFDLPNCCLKCVRVGNRSIVFDYGSREVRVVFRLLGGRYDVVSR